MSMNRVQRFIAAVYMNGEDLGEDGCWPEAFYRLMLARDQIDAILRPMPEGDEE